MKCLSFFPQTIEMFIKSTERVEVKPPIKFSSVDLRVMSLAMTLFCTLLIIASPFLHAYKCWKHPSNPLDLVIGLIAAPILYLFASIRCLLGAIIHPGISFKYTPEHLL